MAPASAVGFFTTEPSGSPNTIWDCQIPLYSRNHRLAGLGDENRKSPFYLFIYFWLSLSFFFFFSFIFVSWKLITLQYFSGFCHTLTRISHGFTCVPHPNPPSHLPPPPIPLGFPSAPALSTCLMHPTWAGDLFHPWQYTCFNATLSEHPNLAFSHRVPSLLCTSVSLFMFCILGYHYHLSKFHIYALVYCIGVYLSGFLHSV